MCMHIISKSQNTLLVCGIPDCVEAVKSDPDSRWSRVNTNAEICS